MDANNAVLLGLFLVTGFFALLLFLSLGPAGWLAIGAVVVAAAAVKLVREDDPSDGDDRAATGWNCRDCGARNDADAVECHHCGTPRGAGSDRDRRVDW